jgi:hypothetical protein
MVMPRSLAATLIFGLMSVAAPARSAPDCFRFEPAVATISGPLVRHTFAGPPNYEDVKKGDRPETGWYVRLAEPICFVGTPGDAVNGEDVAGVDLVQLVLTHDEYKTHGRLVGQNVKATGTFFHWHTGHHHTPVLLTVTRLERADR